ncbi:MAG TPA: efflux RND transporter periplasmic adaptor subunit [Candidatus Sulfotelmatobacter sp.]|nr:efflux RND transporter periplasmic adaptor subunit [Candidatus Sulfotelmatobacter sp.]
MKSTHILLLTLFSTLIVTACSDQARKPEPAPETVRNVSLIEVQQKNMPDALEAVGSLRAAQTSTLASQMMGTLTEIRAHEGDRVQRGEVLAVIDESQPRAALDRANAADAASRQQLAAAEADLTLSESTLKRFQALFDRKSISPQEFDEVKARQLTALARRDMARADQEQAKAAIAQATTALAYTRIRAPFDGVVTERKADVGTLASPGMPIFTLEEAGRYRLEATVNESDLAFVRMGQRVPVLIDALGSDALTGKVVEVVPAADASSRSFLIKVEMPPDSRLRSGLFGRAQFSRGERKALLVPQTAVVGRGQMQGVYLLDQNQVAGLHYVTLGKPNQGQVEVLAGLQVGDWLVATPGTLELDGKRIEAQR